MSISILFAAALVQQATPAEPASKGRQLDPNQVVCEKIEVLGTRLATKRVCMTRREWAEQRAIDRQQIDRAQVQRSCTNTAC